LTVLASLRNLTGIPFMVKFRADHYLVAELEGVTDVTATANSVLGALKDMPELKDLAVVSRRMEGRQWSEILGRLIIPEGSRAFWGMVKREVTPREPYNLFIRIDVNAEAPTIEEARDKVKSWVEAQFVPRIKKDAAVKTIRVLQARDLYLPKLG